MFPLRAVEGASVSNLPLLLVTFAGLLSSIACATPLASHPASGSRPVATAERWSTPAVSAAGARVFPTVEAAVQDALEAAHHRAGPSERERFRFGTIRRVSGGFAWSAPVRSREAITASGPNRVRLQLGPDDVAIYGVHPPSGQSELDQRNESVSRQERRVVDAQEVVRRPLYVLTPSRRIVRYPEAPETLEVVRRETPVAR